MKHIVAVPTGYMGSGSSAVTDLLSEIDGFEQNNGSFEYIFLHCPNGLFDLEDKLLRGNTAMRSDEAIHGFLRYMQILYHEQNYWFSNYREKISPDFLRFCTELIDDLDPVGMTGVHWYYQENINSWRNRARWQARRLLAGITKQKYLFGKPLRPMDYYDVRLAYPEPETFYAAARAYLDKIFASLGRDEHPLVLDQLLLPHNLCRIGNYFDDNLRVFVTERDPRDVYLLNKYHWLPRGVAIPLPTEPEAFCRVYAGMRRSETPADDPRILRLRFEDLIYRYDETCARIYGFLGVSPDRHTRRGTLLRPEVSVNNTRLFLRQPEHAAETAVIERELAPYLYDFPEDDGAAWESELVF